MKDQDELEKAGDWRGAFGVCMARRPVYNKRNKKETPLVYLIECQGLIKIGVSADPETRLKELGTGSPHQHSLLKVIPGGFEVERMLHKKFSDKRVRGEWFRLTSEDLEGLS